MHQCQMTRAKQTCEISDSPAAVVEELYREHKRVWHMSPVYSFAVVSMPHTPLYKSFTVFVRLSRPHHLLPPRPQSSRSGCCRMAGNRNGPTESSNSPRSPMRHTPSRTRSQST